MAYRDFREFLDVLRREGELIDVNRPVGLVYDVAKALCQSNACNGPALLFTQNGTEFPLVAGVYSTRRKALLAFQASEETLFERVLSGLDHPIAPKLIEGAAPCQEVVLTGDAIDIRRFPIPTYSPMDGGPFITPGIVVSKDPRTGVADIGHYRFQVLGKDRLTFFSQRFHRFAKNIAKAKELGMTLQAALVIGVDPLLAYTCQVQSSDATDDWNVAGGLRGEPVELVRCKTVDVQVPAHAEVVIEFEVDLAQEALEGPLGEYTGYYTPASEKPTARITAITHRKKPYFQGLLTGKPVTENHILKQIPFEASFWRTLKQQFPTVSKVAITASGGVQFYTVIAMQPRFAGEARQAIMAAMTSNVRPKWVIAVEPDIDVHNPADIEWAMALRVRPGRDVFVMGGLPAGPADPSVEAKGPLVTHLSSSVGIDATRPVGEEFAQVADVPGWKEFHFPELSPDLHHR